MIIDAPWRAEGLEHSLYQCAARGKEFVMASRGTEPFCTACGARWKMDDLGRLQHKQDGFSLTSIDYGAAGPDTLHFPAKSTFSIHTEYDYRGQGECVTLSTPDNTYFLYPMEPGFSATKIQFATETLWRQAQI